VRSSRGTNEYNDELKTGQSCSYEGIYTNDFNEKEVKLYVLEVILKVGALS